MAGSDSTGGEAAGGALEADRSSCIEDQDGPFEISALSFPKRGIADASGLLISSATGFIPVVFRPMYYGSTAFG